MIRGLFKHASNVPALAIGVLVGATMLSGVAVAAAPGLVTIADPTGTNKVSVNGAGQLLAAESNPRNTVRVIAQSSQEGICTNLYTVPAGKALIVKSVNIYDHSTGTGNPEVLVFHKNCTSVIFEQVFPTSPIYGSAYQDFSLGVPVPSGDKVNFECFSNFVCTVLITGYLVPAALVPANAGTTGAAVPSLQTR
jgi:hypothetical protein